MQHETSKSGFFDLQGRTALITGSRRGIGLALAKALGDAGAAIILHDRNVARLEGPVLELRARGISVDTIGFDALDGAAIDAAASRLAASGRQVDILVNNVGINVRRKLEEFTLPEWQLVLDTNLTSAFVVSKAFVPAMIERRAGKIINICSLMSELGRGTTGAYTASKGGLKMLTRAMCVEWASRNIQVNGIGPGYFRTEMTQALADDPDFSGWLAKRTPAARWGEVHELGGAAVFLASGAADFVNGQVIYVDGGFTASM